MKSLDPRVRLFAILLFTSLGLLLRSPVRMLLVAAATFAFALLLRVPVGRFFGKFRAFLRLLAVLVLVQILFVRTGAPLVSVSGIPIITADGLNNALTLLLRLTILFGAASIMAAESSRRVIQGLIQLRVPYLFAFMLNVALRFLPLFTESFSDAMTSIRLRGVEIGRVPVGKRLKLYGYLLLPVVADAVVKSQNLAMAMAARGFGAYKTRTSLLRLSLRKSDWVTLLALALLGAGALYLHYTIPIRGML